MNLGSSTQTNHGSRGHFGERDFCTVPIEVSFNGVVHLVRAQNLQAHEVVDY